MKIGLTGITSGVGLRLAEVLLEEGHQVSGLVRQLGRADARWLRDRGARLVSGDLESETALAEMCADRQVVFHLAAQVGDRGPAAGYVRVNVGGTRRAIEAAAKAKVQRFVHLSSTAVYGDTERGRVDEHWPTTYANLPYEDTKRDAERTAFRLGRELGIEVVAIRPPAIYGPHDRNFLPRAIDALRKGQFVFIEGGHSPLNLVWVDHLVDVLILAASTPGIAGEAFNVTDQIDEPPPTVKQVAEAIARGIGVRPPRISLPYPLALGLSHLVEKGFALAGEANVPPVTPFVIRVLNRRVVYDASKAVRVLGYKPRKRSLDGVYEQALAFPRAEKR